MKPKAFFVNFNRNFSVRLSIMDLKSLLYLWEQTCSARHLPWWISSKGARIVLIWFLFWFVNRIVSWNLSHLVFFAGHMAWTDITHTVKDDVLTFLNLGELCHSLSLVWILSLLDHQVYVSSRLRRASDVADVILGMVSGSSIDCQWHRRVHHPVQLLVKYFGLADKVVDSSCRQHTLLLNCSFSDHYLL